jgi:hypothetical protein
MAWPFLSSVLPIWRHRKTEMSTGFAPFLLMATQR